MAILDGKDTAIEPESLKSLISEYHKVITEEHATAEKTKRALDHFLGIVGNAAIDGVSPFLIEKWKTTRAKEVSKSTVNRELTVLRGFFSRCCTWNKLRTSPMNDVADYDVDDVRVRVLSDAELSKVLAMPDYEMLLCRATLESLARISELLSLRTEHIGPSWIERRVKGGSVIRVQITDSLRTALLTLAPTSGYVFGRGPKGKPPTQQTASLRVVRALERAGIKDASHHTLRHTGVTLMLDMGVNPQAIQRLAGWSSLRMLERYGHVRDAEVRRAVEGISAHLNALPTTDHTEKTEVAVS